MNSSPPILTSVLFLVITKEIFCNPDDTDAVLADFRRRVFQNCALLGYAARSGNSLQTFRDNVSVSSSRATKTHEYGTDRLYRNVGKELPLHAAQQPRRTRFSTVAFLKNRCMYTALSMLVKSPR